MNGSNIISQSIKFILYLSLQILLVRNLVIFDKAFCFAYLGFLLLLPLELGTVALLLIGFVTGITVDIFYDSLGTHAAGAVGIMYLRALYISLIMPKGGYDAVAIPSIGKMGFNWFVTYTLPLIFIYLFIIFFIEAGGFGMFWFTITKVFMSTALTFIVITIIQYFFYSPKKSTI
jgi:hypothetical protein